MTDYLVAFLTARVDEDEEVARRFMTANRRPTNLQWFFDTTEGMKIRSREDVLIVAHTWPNEAEHITRHDPARVLRDVAFKRDLLRTAANPWEQVPSLQSFLRHLAAVYQDHPDYQEAWRPAK